MAKELNQFFNVPTQWIENKARNTEENASFTKNILIKDHIQKNYFSNKSMAYETSQISFLKNKDLMFFLLQRQAMAAKEIYLQNLLFLT